MWRKLRQQIGKWQGVLIAAPTVAGLVIAITSSGLLQMMEWATHDQWVRLRPREPIDSRIIIVTINESDLQKLGKWPVSDAVLAQLIKTLKAHQPSIIGLDLYRNLPVAPGQQALIQVFKSTPNIIGVEKAVGEAVAPHPTLSQLGQVASADLVLDADGKVRRGLLTIKDKGRTQEGLGVKLALKYLESKGLSLQMIDAKNKHYRLGKAEFKPFTGSEAVYVGTNSGGYQILLNFRGTQENFRTVSITDVLANRISSNVIKGRIVLIGATGQSSNDFFFTPYSGHFFTSPKRMPGVIVHANITSQILSAALEGRPLVHVWPDPVEWLWITGWAFVGATVGWILLQSNLFGTRWIVLGLWIVPTGGILFTGSFLAFLAGWWIPVVSPFLALTGSLVLIGGYYSLELQREKDDLQIVLDNTTEHYDTLTTELQNQAEEAVRASERKLAQFLDAVSVGVAVMDAAGKPYYFNQRAIQLLGKEAIPSATPERLSEVYQIYVAGTDQLYPKEHLPVVRALHGESSTADDMEIRQGDKIIPLEIWGIPIYDEQGNIAYAIAAFQDITERKRSQEALRRAEEKYRSIFENALEGIFQTTPDGRYLSANPALAHIFGYNSPEELMTTLTDVEQLYVDPHRRLEFLRLMQQNGAVSGFESQVYRKDGSIIWISENARAVRDGNGERLYYQGFVEDVTQRKRAEAERIKFTNQLYELNNANERFVPRQFLQLLKKESIIDVELGDQVQLFMSILFSDIRNFTTLSETMTPQENFKFINTFLSHMEPAIHKNNGFIDKYIGDAIMALFSGSADEAVKAGVDMLHRLAEYNTTRTSPEHPPLKIGIGINSGSLMLGTVGSPQRMDSTVISDAVNLAARLEELTKYYGVSLLISHHTFGCLRHPLEYSFRFIDRLRVKGKSEIVSVFEIFDADPAEIRMLKSVTKPLFEQALFLYSKGSLEEASQLFQDCLEVFPEDRVAQIYLERCQQQSLPILVE